MWTLLSSLMTPRVLIALGLSLAASLLLWRTYESGKDSGKAEITAAWNVERIAQAQETVRLAKIAQEKQSELQAAADQLLKDEHEKYLQTATQRDTALAAVRLQHKPRPADYVPPTPAAAASAPGCSAATLFAEDSAVIVGVAAEHDDLRTAYLGCQAQYNAAREALKEIAP